MTSRFSWSRRNGGSRVVEIALFLALFLMAGSRLPGQYNYYPVDPAHPYYRPPLKKARFFSAREYWKAKREALEKGNRRYLSPSELAARKLADDKDTEKKKRKKVRRGLRTRSSMSPKLEEHLARYGETGEKSVASTRPTTPTTARGGDDASGKETSGTPASRGSRRRSVMSFQEFERQSCRRILRKLIGTPYSESGDSPDKGFSPLGLVKHVMSSLGYEPPSGGIEALWERFGLLLDVPYGDFAPGDILFFRLYSKSEQRGKLFVAICLDDESMVYPSFTRQKVVSRSYRDKFWRDRFVGAKRIFID